MSDARILKASMMIWLTSLISGASASTVMASSLTASTCSSVSCWMTSFRAEMRGLCLGDVRRPDNFIGQHQIDQTDSGRLGLDSERSDLLSGHKTEVQQHVDQIIVFFCHVSSKLHASRDDGTVLAGTEY